jgi:5-methyltetrahydrofolate--homocysteine methyltransferase
MLENGAAAINVCLDGARTDTKTALTRFLNLGLCYPDFARAPVMIESSDWEAVEAALKCLPEKALAYAISLKEGEAEFVRKAWRARRYGAAVAVRLFDEQGRADCYERKIAVAGRSYVLLTGGGFPPEDIVFDPVMPPASAGSGREHDREHTIEDFIRACAWIKKNCQGVTILGMDLSAGFQGDGAFRKALYAVFLEHAAQAGLTLAVVNPGDLASRDAVDPELRRAARAAIFGREPG